ncbi:hypothetical protein HDU76_013921 [Blyttiomyces sp. JEL0837]|nr:hypothetical protein HDU76_013921 [Blyttiomyces sp. JEL0837]
MTDTSRTPTMRAVVFVKEKQVKVRHVPKPRAEDLLPGEAIVKVHLAGLCGSDLHIYRGAEPVPLDSITMGHEMSGEIIAIKPLPSSSQSSSSSTLKPGTKVVSPFTTSCLQCEPCLQGFTSRCTHSRLFGGSTSLQGCQAEYVLVKDAYGTLINIDEIDTNHDHVGFSDAGLLLCADILPTGYFAVLQALTHPNISGKLRTGGTVAWPESIWRNGEVVGNTSTGKTPIDIVILGLGPVGLCALVSLLDVLSRPGDPPLVMHSDIDGKPLNRVPVPVRIWGVDGVGERRMNALKIFETLKKSDDEGVFGDVLFESVDVQGAVDYIKTKKGVVNGVDAVLEVVGSPDAIRLGYDLLKPFGVLSSVGVHTAPTFPVIGGELYDKNIAMNFGRCPVRSILPHALKVLSRRQKVLGNVVTDERKSSDGVRNQKDVVCLVDRIVDVGKAVEMGDGSQDFYLNLVPRRK